MDRIKPLSERRKDLAAFKGADGQPLDFQKLAKGKFLTGSNAAGPATIRKSRMEPEPDPREELRKSNGEIASMCRQAFPSGELAKLAKATKHRQLKVAYEQLEQAIQRLENGPRS